MYLPYSSNGYGVGDELESIGLKNTDKVVKTLLFEDKKIVEYKLLTESHLPITSDLIKSAFDFSDYPMLSKNDQYCRQLLQKILINQLQKSIINFDQKSFKIIMSNVKNLHLLKNANICDYEKLDIILYCALQIGIKGQDAKEAKYSMSLYEQIVYTQKILTIAGIDVINSANLLKIKPKKNSSLDIQLKTTLNKFLKVKNNPAEKQEFIKEIPLWQKSYFAIENNMFYKTDTITEYANNIYLHVSGYGVFKYTQNELKKALDVPYDFDNNLHNLEDLKPYKLDF